MENATKALIIAAAILIAIVLISLGVFVLGQGTTMVKENSDMSDVEISTYNSKFEAYLGSNVSGTRVKQLISAVNQHNKANKGDDSRIITLDSDVSNLKTSGGTDKDSYNAGLIGTGKSYEVKAKKTAAATSDNGYTSGGLISDIYIDEKP